MKFPAYDKVLFAKMLGVRLDVGCGAIKQRGFLGMDRLPLPGVDIVHDLQAFPWPVPDDICTMIVMSHTWEHIEPKFRSLLMDELWRIIRWDGQLFISCPYAGSFLESAHPEHYGCPNEMTFTCYSPDYVLFRDAMYGMAKPWKIIRNDPNNTGCLEVILEPYKDKKGQPCAGKARYWVTTPLSR